MSTTARERILAMLRQARLHDLRTDGWLGGYRSTAAVASELQIAVHHARELLEGLESDDLVTGFEGDGGVEWRIRELLSAKEFGLAREILGQKAIGRAYNYSEFGRLLRFGPSRPDHSVRRHELDGVPLSPQVSMVVEMLLAGAPAPV